MRPQPNILLLFAGAVSLAAAANTISQTTTGPQLPKKWGFGVTYYTQNQPYVLESLELGLPGLDPSLADSLDVENTTDTLHATFDYWLLPFLNVQVLLGNLESDTDVGLSAVNIGIPLEDLRVRSEGLVYGGGLTLVLGNERIFGTLTGEYMETRLDEEGASVTAWIATPKLGMVFAPGVVGFVGAMYQKPEERHTGTYTIPQLGTVSYSVDLTSESKWGYLAGVTVGISENWVATVEGGFGDRTSFLAHLDYRF